MSEKKITCQSGPTRLSLGILCWLGGAVWVSNQPGYDGWDGLIWLYYVGRYIAAHFAMLH